MTLRTSTSDEMRTFSPRATMAMLVPFLLILLFPQICPAQTGSRLARVQEETREYLRSIEVQMEALSARLAESQPQDADRLQKARTRLIRDLLVEDMRKISEALKEESYVPALDTIQRVRSNIEVVLSILRDRGLDPEELAEKLDELSERRMQVGELADSQRALRNKTQNVESSASDVEMINEAQRDIDEMVSEQETLRGASDQGENPSAQQITELGEEARKLSEDLARQARRQQALARLEERTDDLMRRAANDRAQGQGQLARGNKEPEDPAWSELGRSATAQKAETGQIRQSIAGLRREVGNSPQDRAVDNALREAQENLDEAIEAAGEAASDSTSSPENSEGSRARQQQALAAARDALREARDPQGEESNSLLGRLQNLQEAFRGWRESESGSTPDGDAQEASQALDRASRALTEAQRIGAETTRQGGGQQQSGEQQGGQQQGGQQQSGEQQGGQQQSGEQQSGEQQGGEQQGGQQQSGEQQSGQQQSGEQQSGEQQSGEQQSGQQQSGEQQAQKTQEAARQAAEAADRMEKLSNSASSETPSSRQQELASKVDALEKKLAALEKKLGQRDSTSPEEDEKLRKKVGAAREALQRARNSMKQAASKMSGSQSASGEQSSAESALSEAKESLANSEEDALDRLKRKEEELAQIQKEQDELERLTRKMAQEEEGSESLSGAAGSMGEASESLGQGQTSRARQQQEEALEQLEQEESRLQEEEMELADLKTEQDLIDLIATVTEMSDEMESIHTETIAVSRELGDSRANRSQKARLRGLSRRVAEVDEVGQDVHRRLEEEEARVFTYIMEDLLEDLAEVKESLQPRYDPGEVTQMLEQEILDELQRLRSSLEEELRRRMQQQQEQQQQQQPGGGRPRMVPPAAELIALKRMQEEVLDRTRRIDSIRKRNEGDLDILQEQLLERLIQRQGSIIELTDQIASDLGEQLQPEVNEEVSDDDPAPPEDEGG